MKAKRKPYTRSPLAFRLGGWPTCFEGLEEKHTLWLHLWITPIPTVKTLYIHLPTQSQDPFPKCWIYYTPIDQLQHTQTHTHTSCLCASTWGALGKEEAGSRLQPLEQFMSICTGSSINCSSSGSPTPGCQLSWETHSSSFTTRQPIKRWGGTIKPLGKKMTTSRRLLSKQRIWPILWCQWPSRKESTWSQAREITSQWLNTLIYKTQDVCHDALYKQKQVPVFGTLKYYTKSCR